MLPGEAMEYRNKTRVCLNLIKEYVKKNAIGYQQLADRLGVSLLTIKRQLNGDEISMSKLLALCDAAQLSFSEIWQQVEQRKVEHTVFSEKQDHAFYHFPHLLSYFLELCYYKQSPEQIQKRWKISSASTHIYLRELEKLALIRLSEKSKATLLVSEPIGFGNGSLNVIKDIQAGLNDVSEKLIAPREDEPFVIVKPMLLSEELRDKMYAELAELVSRYAELSERYFIESSHPAFQLVVCDYKIQEQAPLADIIDVKNFKRA